MAKAISRDRYIQWKLASKSVAHVRHQRYRSAGKENVPSGTLV